VHAVAICPDGRSALSGSDDQTLRLWDLHTGKTRVILRGHTAHVHAVAISPNTV
jgi:WD40 repeat protein